MDDPLRVVVGYGFGLQLCGIDGVGNRDVVVSELRDRALASMVLLRCNHLARTLGERFRLPVVTSLEQVHLYVYNSI